MTNPAENAIPTDALEQSEQQAGATNEDAGTLNNPRMSAMEAIAQSRRESLRQEGVELDDEPSTLNDSAPADAAPPETNDDQLAAQLGADDRAASVATETMKVKVKVDGEEMELPLSEVVKSYQKDAAATRRLQEAQRILQLAEQQAINIAQNGNTGKNDSQQPEAGQGEVNETERLAQIKEAFSKLYEGDEDAAAVAMLKLLEQGAGKPATQAQPINPAELVPQVVQQLEFNSAYAAVQQDYPALFANDERGVVLGKATYERLVAKESAGVPKAQALREASEEVASLFGIQKAGRQQGEPQRTARDEKLARKASLDVPSGANVVAGGPASPAEAPNVSSVIQEMAKARLGQSLNVR